MIFMLILTKSLLNIEFESWYWFMECHSWFLILILNRCNINIDCDSRFWNVPALWLNHLAIAQCTLMQTQNVIALDFYINFDCLSFQGSRFEIEIPRIFQSWFWCWLCDRVFKNFDIDFHFLRTLQSILKIVNKLHY